MSKHAVVPVSLSCPISCKECTVGSRAVYADLFNKDPDWITPRRRAQRSIGTRHTLIREGEILESCYTLFSGWAFRFKMLGNGRRQILSFYIPGDFLVPQGIWGRPVPFAVKSITPVALCVFDRAEMLALLMQSTTSQKTLYDTMVEHCSEIDRRLVDVGRRSAVGRVAHMLLEFEAKLAEKGLVQEGRFEFPLRQEHIADALGLTTVHVNRTLVGIRDKGLINFRRNEMEILEFVGLRELSEED